jgi:4-azaleucine resistance transporter AzlC
MVLSLVMFSGASQFAFVGVIAAGGSPFAAVPAALLLAVRNAFYGVPMSEILHPRGVRRLITAHFVIDETTAMAVGQQTQAGKRFAFWSTGLILCALWQLGSLVGALVGRAIDPEAFGLDAASPAVYLALMWPAFKRVEARWVAAIGAVIALALVPVAPAGVPVIAAASAALVGGLLPPRTKETEPVEAAEGAS